MPTDTLIAKRLLSPIKNEPGARERLRKIQKEARRKALTDKEFSSGMINKIPDDWEVYKRVYPKGREEIIYKDADGKEHNDVPSSGGKKKRKKHSRKKHSKKKHSRKKHSKKKHSRKKHH